MAPAKPAAPQAMDTAEKGTTAWAQGSFGARESQLMPPPKLAPPPPCHHEWTKMSTMNPAVSPYLYRPPMAESVPEVDKLMQAIINADLEMSGGTSHTQVSTASPQDGSLPSTSQGANQNLEDCVQLDETMTDGKYDNVDEATEQMLLQSPTHNAEPMEQDSAAMAAPGALELQITPAKAMEIVTPASPVIAVHQADNGEQAGRLQEARPKKNSRRGKTDGRNPR